MDFNPTIVMADQLLREGILAGYLALVDALVRAPIYAFWGWLVWRLSR